MEYASFAIEPVSTEQRAPLYAQIRAQIEAALRDGQIRPGQLLLPERELASAFDVSRLTLRQALAGLESAGVLTRVAGVGTFISQAQLRLDDLISFSENMRQQGRRPSSMLVRQGIIDAVSGINQKLRIPPAAQLVRVSRVRLVDDNPVMVETSYFSAEQFADLATLDVTDSLYRILRDRYRVTVHRVQEVLNATLVREDESELLTSRIGAPAFYRELTAYDSQGKPVEFSTGVVRGDMASYSLTLTEGESANRDFSMGLKPVSTSRIPSAPTSATNPPRAAVGRSTDQNEGGTT